MKTSPNIKAALMLFDLVSKLEPRIAPLADWYTKVLIPTADKWSRSEGDQGIKRVKEALSKGWLYILGEDLGEPMAFTKATRGVPDLVLPLVDRISHLEKDDRLLSVVLTIVRVTDLWYGHGDESSVKKQLRTIRDSRLPGTAQAVISEFQSFVHGFLSAKSSTPFGKAVAKRLAFSENYYHSPKVVGTIYSEKSGPNGPLSASAHLDWCSISGAKTTDGSSLKEGIFNLEQAICDCLEPGCSLKASMLWEGYSVDQVSGGKAFSKYPGKISQIREKSGKVRLVASPDYFSQQAMKPIHDWLMNLLRSLPMDCTFDQRSSIPKIVRWQSEGRTVYSVDQSSCTDLFPMDCQEVILEEAFGNNLAHAVRTVMCDREWEVKLPSGKTTAVRWGVGQPMGIYGSWPLMAVTHHLLVQYSHWRASGRKSFETFRDYVICGDDIVIGRKATAESYLKVVKLLGMKVNLAKSHISGGRTHVDPVSEFAKITIWKGKPLYPVRPNMVLSSVKDWRYAVPLLIDLADRTGFAARRKFLTTWISKYFPSKKKFLEPLLSVPALFGGVGLGDSKSLLSKFTGLQTGQIHPWILYLGNKIRSGMLLENQLCSYPRAVSDVGILREHPIWELMQIQDARSRFVTWRGLPSSRDSEVPTVQEICKQIVLDGIERFAQYLPGTDDASQCPGPNWDDTAKQRQLKNRSLWEKSLRAPVFWVKPEAHNETWLPTSRSLDPVSQYELVSHVLTGLGPAVDRA